AGGLQQLGGALAGIEALRPVLSAADLLVVVGGVPEVVHLLAEDPGGGQHAVGRAGAGLLQLRGLLLDALPHLGVRGEPAGTGRQQRERPLRGPDRRTGSSGARNQLLPGHGCSFGSRGRAQRGLPVGTISDARARHPSMTGALTRSAVRSAPTSVRSSAG